MTHRTKILSITLFAALLGSVAPGARADSVAQIATAVRINRGTARLIDPQGRPGMMGSGSLTAVRPGDILTFTAAFTPVPNGGVRGLGGYVTVYIPRNTEVVSARFIDSMGRTVAPHRGGIGAEGTGPRGSETMSVRTALPDVRATLNGGTMSQLYADTGIFFSTDLRTTRVPNGTVMSEVFISLHNGLLMSPSPTAYGQLNGRLGSLMPFAHNEWDVIQAYAFGVGGSVGGTGGRGNTPDLYGSPVAGGGSFYQFAATATTAPSVPATIDDVFVPQDMTARGPWNRIQSYGAEIGRRGIDPAVTTLPSPGLATRIGVPALDSMGRPLGLRIDADGPLPSYDASSPTDPYVNALRFAVGELVVGEEYLSEFSLRVLDTPLDPVAGTDTVCAEVFGGDASAEDPDGSNDGKDNAWRYFLPAPACVDLGLLFDLDVSHLVILPGGTLTYTITVKNLSTRAHTNVNVTHCYDGNVNFMSATAGSTMGSGGDCDDDFIQWMIPRIDPGVELTYTLDFEARGGETTGRAVFTSTELPSPGFSTVAYTNIGELVIMDLGMTATPDTIATPPGTVHYTATLANVGSGPAASGCGVCAANIALPTGFTLATGTAMVDGTGVGDPTVAGDTLTFTGFPDIAAGGMVTIEFDADVPSGYSPGVYDSSIETWLDAGETISDSRGGLAPVTIGTRSDTPTIDGPLANGARMVCGMSTEAAGTTIRVYYGGVYAAEGMVGAGGLWCVTVPTLFPGLAVSATAEATGEAESLPSAEESVSTVMGGACSDGIDNDGDGFTDFPEDPECDSPEDNDEARHAECADGADNDADTLVDFGSDPGCSSLLDDSEDGVAACMNGVDDDGDGLTDFPEDPGCTSADDVSERVLPQCANGMDDDSDGLTDYPFDPGCSSAVDNDEVDDGGPGVDGGGVPGTDGGGVGTDGGGVGTDGGDDTFPDPGGVDRPGDGCGCTVGRTSDGAGWGALGLLALMFVRRRRR